jgi:hypothetical protein
MDDHTLRERLHSLGEVDVAPSVASAHLTRMATVRPRRLAAASLALAVTFVGSAAAVGVTLAAQSPRSLTTRPTPGAVGAPPFEVPRRLGPPSEVATDPCVGPPPFAGIKPAGPRARAVEAVDVADPQLQAAIDALTDDQRAVVLLRFVGDLSLHDVARITRRRIGAVKALQHRALAALERALARSQAVSSAANSAKTSA